MRYSIGQLQQIAREAGWPEDLIVIIAAIGMGESGGDPAIRNPNLARENSIGLWQVNRYAHPQYPESSLRDPIYNARAALEIYNKQGLRAWGAYTDGRYRQYLPASQAAYGGSNSLPDFSSSFDVSNFTDQLLQPLGLSVGSGAGLLSTAVVVVVGLLVLDWLLE